MVKEDTARLVVGVDIGGTFTDLVALGEQGLVCSKSATTSDAPTRGVVDCLRLAGLTADAVTELLADHPLNGADDVGVEAHAVAVESADRHEIHSRGYALVIAGHREAAARDDGADMCAVAVRISDIAAIGFEQRRRVIARLLAR